MQTLLCVELHVAGFTAAPRVVDVVELANATGGVLEEHASGGFKHLAPICGSGARGGEDNTAGHWKESGVVGGKRWIDKY